MARRSARRQHVIRTGQIVARRLRRGGPDEDCPGVAAEAIPYLEKRLTWDNQTDKVQAELDDARRNAG